MEGKTGEGRWGAAVDESGVLVGLKVGCWGG